MPEFIRLGFPPTDDGPIVGERLGKLARGRVLLETPELDHPVRPNFGTAIADAHFEPFGGALSTAIRIDARRKFRIYEPGLFVPRGSLGGGLKELTHDRIVYQLNVIDVDEPEFANDPLEIRLRRG